MSRFALFALIVLVGCGTKEQPAPIPPGLPGIGPGAPQSPPNAQSSALRDTHNLGRLAVSPSGTIAGSYHVGSFAAESWRVGVWDATEKRVLTIPVAKDVLGLAVAPDGKSVAALCELNGARHLHIWSVPDGKPLGSPRDARAAWEASDENARTFVGYARDGKSVVYGRGGAVARTKLGGGAADEPLVKLDIAKTSAMVVHYIAANDRFALLDAAGARYHFKADGAQEDRPDLEGSGHTRSDQALATTADGGRVVWGRGARSEEGFAFDVFDTATGKSAAPRLFLPKRRPEIVNSVAVSASRIAFIFYDTNGTEMELWDPSGKRLARVTEPPGLEGHPMWCCAFSADGKQLYVGRIGRGARVFDASTGAER